MKERQYLEDEVAASVWKVLDRLDSSYEQVAWFYDRTASILLMPVDTCPEEQGMLVTLTGSVIKLYNGDLVKGEI